MKCPKWLIALRSAALVAALLIMQTAVLTHFDGADTHPTSDSCVLCAGAAMLGAANVAAPQTLEAVRAFEPPPGYAEHASTVAPTVVVLPRGPPLKS